LQGVCLAACRVVYRALGRTVGQCARREDVADTPNQSRECNLSGSPTRISMTLKLDIALIHRKSA